MYFVYTRITPDNSVNAFSLATLKKLPLIPLPFFSFDVLESPDYGVIIDFVFAGHGDGSFFLNNKDVRGIRWVAQKVREKEVDNYIITCFGLQG